jgi:serine/threonine protein kinase
VRKKSDGKVYAMKILKKRAIIERNQVEHTNAERKILQALQHPFLMTLRYAFQSKEKLYFVLDYFTGHPPLPRAQHARTPSNTSCAPCFA